MMVCCAFLCVVCCVVVVGCCLLLFGVLFVVRYCLLSAELSCVVCVRCLLVAG